MKMLPISSVFNKLKDLPAATSPVRLFIPEIGQTIRISRSVRILASLGDMTCSVCGCNGTHLEYSDSRKNEHKKKSFSWKVMSFNKMTNDRTFLNIDHIIPLSKNGTWDSSNLQVTCAVCNSYKGNHIISNEEILTAIQASARISKIIKRRAEESVSGKIYRLKTVKSILKNHLAITKIRPDKINHQVDIVAGYIKNRIKADKICEARIPEDKLIPLLEKAIEIINVKAKTQLIEAIEKNARV